MFTGGLPSHSAMGQAEPTTGYGQQAGGMRYASVYWNTYLFLA